MELWQRYRARRKRSIFNRTVVICGSMKHLGRMSSIGNYLRSAGLRVVVPIPDEPAAGRNTQAPSRIKRDASRRHLNHIRRRRTTAVLVVNVGRPGAPNYIAPNTFAEIGVAFSNDRRIYLLHGMPESYAEELGAWGVQCLDGDIRPFLKALSAREDVNLADWTGTVQPASA